MTYKLKNWSLCSRAQDMFLPPELVNIRIGGEIVEHPTFAIGSEITTNMVIELEGRVVKTLSGSLYELVGDPDPRWVKWLASQGKEPDPHNLLSIRDKAEVV